MALLPASINSEDLTGSHEPQPLLSEAVALSEDSADITSLSARFLFGYQLNSPSALKYKYNVKRQIGAGGHGRVLEATTKDNMVVAIKIIPRTHMHLNRWAVTREDQVLPMEAAILQRIRHPNVIGFLDWFADDEVIYLVSRRIVRHW